MAFQQSERPDTVRDTSTATHRRLSQLYPPGKFLFLTWQLHGSVPHTRYPPTHKANAGAAFVWMDRYLDAGRAGPLYLRREPIATLRGLEQFLDLLPALSLHVRDDAC
jgi:hypothetical protein